jgi:hypothetical protein
MAAGSVGRQTGLLLNRDGAHVLCQQMPGAEPDVRLEICRATAAISQSKVVAAKYLYVAFPSQVEIFQCDQCLAFLISDCLYFRHATKSL